MMVIDVLIEFVGKIARYLFITFAFGVTTAMCAGVAHDIKASGLKCPQGMTKVKDMSDNAFCVEGIRPS